MTQFSTDIQNVAIELINEFGSDVTVTRYNGTYNPSTGENVTTTQTFTATIVTDSFTNMELTLSALGATSSDSLLRGSDKKIYVAYSATYTPEVGDNISYKSKDYRIADVKVMDLQQDTYLYKVRLEI